MVLELPKVNNYHKKQQQDEQKQDDDVTTQKKAANIYKMQLNHHTCFTVAHDSMLQNQNC
jgi:hypothetical protein